MNQRFKIAFLLGIWITCLFSFRTLNSQNTNLDNLLTASDWNSLFPKRAGTFGVHPQGYTTDFYSFQNLKQAVNEMADYLVTIKTKNGVWGRLITIKKKSSSVTYIYNDVDANWYNNSSPVDSSIIDFESFVNRSSNVNNKRELAAFLSNISKETTGGWQLPVGGGSEGDYAVWGLYFVHELGYNSTTGAGAYSQANAEYPPNPSVGYYGRGPIQLSWNYNYGQLSKFLFNDKFILLNDPDSVQRNGVLAFKSAIWFWMMPQCPKPSCHQVMHDLWVPQVGEYSSSKMYKKGFAHTNNIINGGLECRSTTSATFAQKVILRSDLYKYYLGIMGFNSGEIQAENANDYTTLCYESASNAMQDYVSCLVQDGGSLGIQNSFKNSEMSLFPNPSQGMIWMMHSDKISQVQIFSLDGKLLKTYLPNKNILNVDLMDLNPGFYLIKSLVGSKQKTQKLIINR